MREVWLLHLNGPNEGPFDASVSHSDPDPCPILHSDPEGVRARESRTPVSGTGVSRRLALPDLKL